LRLNFQISDDRIARLDEQRAFINLATSRKRKEEEKAVEIEAGIKQQKAIKSVLESLKSETIYKNREECIKLLKDKFKVADIPMRAPLLRAIWTALSERDETADVCMKTKKEIEADTELRDAEIIPLSEDIQTYFEREVLPH